MRKNLIILGSEGTIGTETQEVTESIYNIYNVDIDNQSGDKKKHNVKNFRMDITDSSSIEELKLSLKEDAGGIDALVYLPGVNFMSDFFSVTQEKWESTFEINVAAFLFVVKQLYEVFNDTVSIVCIASQNGVVAHEDRVAYGTSKAALIHLVKNLTIEFSRIKSKDIRVNAVSPGYILEEKSEKYFNTTKGKRLINRIPYKKLVEARDVADTIKFLLSNKSKAIRGQNIVLDYGYSLP